MNLLLGLVAVLWLAYCTVVDVRSRKLPLWLTLAPYLLAALYAALNGCWPAAALAVLLIFISDLPVVARYAAFLVLLVLAAWLSPSEAARWVAMGVGLIWLVWDLAPGVWGGSDARILMALTLLAQDARIVLFLLIGMAVAGILYRWRRGTPVPLTPGILAGLLVYLGVFLPVLFVS